VDSYANAPKLNAVPVRCRRAPTRWRLGRPRVATPPRRHCETRGTMALNRDFYADCFARSALGRFDGAAAPKAATPFAAAAKKEFDLTSFLKDLAAVRARAL